MSQGFTRPTSNTTTAGGTPIRSSRFFWADATQLPATGFVGSGQATVTITTPGAAVNPFSDATGTYCEVSTSNVSGNAAGIVAFFTGRYDNITRFTWIVKTPVTLTSLRIWIGLNGNGNSQFNDADSPDNQSIAFRYSTVAADTNWQCFTRTTVNTQVDSGVVVSSDTRYVFEVVVTTSQVQFYINGTLVATSTTNIPTASTTPGLAATVRTQTTAARLLRLCHCEYESS